MTDQKAPLHQSMLRARRLRWMSTGILITITLAICIALALRISYLRAIEEAEAAIDSLWLISNDYKDSTELSKPNIVFEKGRTPSWRVEFTTGDLQHGSFKITFGGEVEIRGGTIQPLTEVSARPMPIPSQKNKEDTID